MRLILFLILSTALIIPGTSFAEDDEGVSLEKAHYASLKPSLVVNIASGARYARLDIQVMTRNEDELENIKLHSPAIRHELILLLSEQQGTTLKTPEGKEAFRATSLNAIRNMIRELTGKNSVEDLYFTSFFVQ